MLTDFGSWLLQNVDHNGSYSKMRIDFGLHCLDILKRVLFHKGLPQSIKLIGWKVMVCMALFMLTCT